MCQPFKIVATGYLLVGRVRQRRGERDAAVELPAARLHGEHGRHGGVARQHAPGQRAAGAVRLQPHADALRERLRREQRLDLRKDRYDLSAKFIISRMS